MAWPASMPMGRWKWSVATSRPARQAELKFLYPELGAIDPNADKAARLKRLAEIITSGRTGGSRARWSTASGSASWAAG